MSGYPRFRLLSDAASARIKLELFIFQFILLDFGSQLCYTLYMMENEVTTESTIKAALDVLIEDMRNVIYMPEYRATASKNDILGIIVAKYLDWDGSDICEVAGSAFEDANYHELAAQIRKGGNQWLNIKS